MSDATETTQVKLRKNGDMTITEDGAHTIIAHYDRKTGHLEYVSKTYATTLHAQCVARIGTVANGTLPSNLVIRSTGVKGDEANAIAAGAPRRPRLGPEGDSAEDYVEWMLKYNLPGAITQYGIYTDDKGQPIRKQVRRVVTNLVDARNDEDDEIVKVKDGSKTWSKAPVTRAIQIIEKDDAVIARRATRGTFSPAEVVGGFQPDDDYDQPAIEGADGEGDA